MLKDLVGEPLNIYLEASSNSLRLEPLYTPLNKTFCVRELFLNDKNEYILFEKSLVSNSLTICYSLVKPNNSISNLSYLDGPAMTIYNYLGNRLIDTYYYKGQIHRLGGPAYIEYTDGKPNPERVFYFHKGTQYKTEFEYLVATAGEI